MRLRLAGGLVTSGQGAWLSRQSGAVRITQQGDAPAGAAVALGPDGADDGRARRAAAELDRLVAAGGVVAAAAGVDLGDGFRSARLAGGRGDQRDAVLGALRALGADGDERLGPRGAVLVALFGPAATKRVGAAAAPAVAEGRWAALRLAAAASDVLGPEQLEQVLALRAPEGFDPVRGGLASALAADLRAVLEPVPARQRVGLVVDLWERVLAHEAELARNKRLLASQGRQDRLPDLRERRARWEDGHIEVQLRNDLGVHRPSLAAAARWTPPAHYWVFLVNRLFADALAATALLRTAVAVADHGMRDGLARSEALLEAAASYMTDMEANSSARQVAGLTGMPARPGNHVREILRWLRKERADDAHLAGAVKPKLAHARDYGLAVLEDVEAALDGPAEVPVKPLRDWAKGPVTGWRQRAGYTAARPPQEWDGVPVTVRERLAQEEPLMRRLRDRPEADAAEVEVKGDLLWLADLYDALAQVYGHDAAAGGWSTGILPLRHNPPPPEEPEPLAPRLDSIAHAASVAAQLAALGGTPGKGMKSWQDLVAALRAGVDVNQVLSTEFRVPAPLAAVDRTLVPGSRAHFRVAYNARTLAEWASYMGNCIAGWPYPDEATKGRSILAALYADNGRILANAEIVAARPAARGWVVEELQGRFNEAPDPELAERFTAWVKTIPAPAPPEEVAATPDEALPPRPAGRRPAPRVLETVAPELVPLSRQAWQEQVTGQVAAAVAAVADAAAGGRDARLAGGRTRHRAAGDWPARAADSAPSPADGTRPTRAAPDRAGATPDITAALTRLRRTGDLTDACRAALAEGAVDLLGLWRASAARPLSSALDGLDPVLHDRFPQLALLTAPDPLPRALRKLVRREELAPAYAMNLVAFRLRAAIGRLAEEGDPAVADGIRRRTSEAMLCALALAATCRPARPGDLRIAEPRAVTVPGFPASDLADEKGPWQRALPDAAELGADTGALWEYIAADGLRVPGEWLAGGGGWQGLWARAHRGGGRG
ncbi:hypothetical protein [Streptomyces coryli]|uniref:hypothetical protein n=1 Tax=Streptomyces coryli TaxID=1128680 RepID=UPI0019D02577|nr:hypothetical protein [Streptomyces coryli]